MHTRGVGASHTGRVRKNNEDSFLVDDELGLYIVADGMGGHAAGEIASKLAIETVLEAIRAGQAVRAAVAEGAAQPRDLVALLEKAVQSACLAVYQRSRSNARFAGMGTTLTIALVAGAHLLLAHVGDSRLYMIRGDEVSRLSADHSLAAELARAGVISEDKVRSHPFANTLTRCVGLQEAVAVDTLVLTVAPGDRFVLCSDGLSNYLDSAAELKEALGDGLEQAATRLIEHANHRGGADNTTVVVVTVDVTHPDAAVPDAVLRRQRALEALSRCPLVEGYPLRQRVHLFMAGRLVRFSRDERLISMSRPVNALYICLSGQLEVRASGSPPVDITAGGVFGVTTVLHERPARATVVGLAPGDVLVIEKERLTRMIRKRPRLGVGTLERLLAHVSRHGDLI